MRIVNETNSATVATTDLTFGMLGDIITNSNIKKAFVVNPCSFCNTDDYLLAMYFMKQTRQPWQPQI